MSKKQLYLILFIVGALMLPSCKDKTLDTTVLTKTMYEDVVFDEIHAEDAWQVIIVQDDQKRGIELEYSAFLEEYLKMTKEGSSLDISFTQRLNLPLNTVMTVTVYVPSLSKLVLEEAASAELQGDFHGDRLEVLLKEKSSLRGGNFFGALLMELSDASKVVDFTADGDSCSVLLENVSVFKGTLTAAARLDLQIKDGSRFTTYGGSATQANIYMTDLAFLNMIRTVVDVMYIELNSASEATVYVVDRLEGSVREASVLYYQGYPVLNVDCDSTSNLSTFNSQL